MICLSINVVVTTSELSLFAIGGFASSYFIIILFMVKNKIKLSPFYQIIFKIMLSLILIECGRYIAGILLAVR